MIARTVLPLLLLLASLAWGSAALVETTTLRWFDEDRAALALLGAEDVELAAAEATAHERAASLRQTTLLLFAGLGALSVPCLLLLKRYFWRRWSNQLGELMSNNEPAGRYSPALRDLRDMVERFARRNEE